MNDYDFYTSEEEWDRDEAMHSGLRNPESAWIHTDRDVWHANPYYKGLPVPHPEEDWKGTLEEYRQSLKD